MEWKTKPIQKAYSEVVDEMFWKGDDGKIHFQCGALYTEREINILMNGDQESIQSVHICKTVFNGSELIK